LPGNAMQARPMPSCMRCLSVYLSVRLSDTVVDSIETNEHIFKKFLPSGSHTILVFRYQTAWHIPTKTP